MAKGNGTVSGSRDRHLGKSIGMLPGCAGRGQKGQGAA